MKSTQNHSARKASLVERRTFIRNAGAALSATVVASTAAVGAEPASDHDAKPAQDEIRQLHHIFVERLNGRRYEELGDLFDHQPDTQRPAVAHFERHLPDGVLPPVHDYLVSHEQHLDSVAVASDRRSATARFHCATRMEAALIATLPLIEMARQQGQGVIQWWESGILESTWVRSASTWKIERLSFHSNGPWPPLPGSTGS